MSQEKILLVEDDPNLGFVVQDQLHLSGYKVHLSRDGKDGLRLFNKNEYDLCLLDVMLPKKDGFSLAADIRKINPHIPIIFFTAKSMIEDKTIGFNLGADDYILKPFEAQELLLRIKAVMKRAGVKKEQESLLKNIFNIGNSSFDYDNYLLSIDGNKQLLTKKEGEILKLLCRQKNQVVERGFILNMVWGDDSYFNGRSLDVFITKLRKYLRADTCLHIKNIHGIGFKLEELQ